jgi:hypothetical protein
MAWVGVVLGFAGCAPKSYADRGASVVQSDPPAGGRGGSAASGGAGGNGGEGGGPGAVGGAGGNGGSGGGSGGAGGLTGGAGGAGGARTVDAPVLGTGGAAPAPTAQPDAAEAPPPPDAALPVDLPPPPPDVPPPPPDVRRGLVGHWRLDEGNGNTVLDSSATQNHGGTVNVLPADWQMGKRNLGIQFTPVRRTFIQIPHHDTTSPRESFSVAFWVLNATWNGTQRLFQKGDADEQYAVRVQGGQLRFLVRLEDGTLVQVSAAAPPTARLAHLAATYDGQQARLYVDGKQVGAMPAAGPLAQSMLNVTAAGRPGGAPDTEFYAGLLDDILFYDRALSATEVRQLVSANAP